jgi:YVTN family beta-propeller protein
MLRTPLPLAASVLLLAALVVPARGQYLETVINLGHGAMEILWNPTSNKVYTANYDNTVSIINGATNEVITTLPVSDNPGNLVWNPTANRIYVACGENRVVAIDGWTDALTADIVLPGYPSQTAYSVTSHKLYVGLDDGRVSVIDGNADTLIRTVRVQSDGDLLLLWHPVTNRVLCSTTCDTIAAVDCATDQVVSKIPTGYGGEGFIWQSCYDPVNGLAYISGWGGVLVLTPEADTVIARVQGYVGGLCVVPFPNKLYLDVWHMEGRIGVLDCSTNAVSDSILLCAGPMACDAVRGKVYVSYVSTSDSLGVVDARADAVVAALPCSDTRNAVCWNSTNSRAYFATQATVIYVVRDTTTGITEASEPVVGMSRPARSVVTRLFNWPGSAAGSVIDAGGRKVAEVRPGWNDLGVLVAGVYVVVDAESRTTTQFIKAR